jgi:hypothetical protein
LSKPPASKPLLGAAGGKTMEPAAKPTAKPAAPAAPAAMPSFEFEDSPPPKAKSKPSAPPAGDVGPALNPFADQPVSMPVGGGSSGPGPGSATPASSASTTPEDEVDIRPGAAKDLWACPHCGARNKPSRTTCRECSKSPSDDIVVPWHKKPKNQAAVAGGVVLVILLFMLLTHHDTSLHPAGAADLDDAVRIGGGGGGERDIEGHHFHGRGTLSVSGRVVSYTAHGSAPWVSVAVLALGHLAVDDERFNGWKLESHDDDYALTNADSGEVPSVTLYLLFKDGERPKITKGDYLSVNGDYGYGEDTDGRYISGTGPDHPHAYTLVVSGHQER